MKSLKRELAYLKAVNASRGTRVQQETAESEALAARQQRAEATCCEWEAAWPARAQQYQSDCYALQCRLREAEAANTTTERRVQQETAEATSLEARLQTAEATCCECKAAWAARAQQDESDWHALGCRLKDAEATSVEQAAKICHVEEQLHQLLAGLRTAGLGSECAAVRI